jgi:3-oxoacyl-[acyl-carrier-protein] synthase II
MSLGEAGAALLLEDLATARQRGATVLAVLTGWGIAADAHHATAPHPEGRGLAAAITQAMDDASLSPRDIDLVIAHATGTRDNDAVECAVLAKHFGAVPTSAIKRSYGHTMGAAAAVELVAAVLAIQHRQHWGSAGCRLPLAGPRILTRTETAPTRCVLSTNLAFGGVNTALLCAAPGDGVPNAITQQTQPMRCLAKGQADSHDSSALPDWVPAAARRRLDANQRLAVLAVAAAIAGHTLPPATAVIVASAYGNVDASWRFAVSLAEHGDHAGSPTPFTTSVHNAVAGCLAALLQLQGPTSTLSDGDGSAEAARDLAQAWLTSGRAPAVLLVLGDRHNPWSRRVLETLAPQRNERDAYTAELWVAK